MAGSAIYRQRQRHGDGQPNGPDLVEGRQMLSGAGVVWCFDSQQQPGAWAVRAQRWFQPW